MTRHETDWGSLIAGLLFVILGLTFATTGRGDWGIDAIWLLPVVAIGLGIAGVVRALTSARRDRPDQHGDSG